MREPWSRTGRTDSGMALVAVLGWLAVLALLVIGIVADARSTLDGAARHLQRAQAQQATESAIDWAANLLAAGNGTLPVLLATPQTLEIGGFRVKVSVRPERAKVDLNAADLMLLETLFRAGGAGPDKARALAAATADWRDADDLQHLDGAERRAYRAAGLRHEPANRPFATVGQARMVLGMTPALFDCLRGEMTVLAQAPGVDVVHAAPALQRALGLDPRAAPPPPDAAPLASGQPLAPGDVFEVTVELDDRARRLRRGERVSIRITGNPQDPFWILSVEPVFPLREQAAAACPRDSDPGRR
jgi:general secretion pathway protein K